MDHKEGDEFKKIVKLADKLATGQTTTMRNKQEILYDLKEKMSIERAAKEQTIESNRKDVMRQEREQIKHYRQKAQDRDKAVAEIKQTIAEDLD